MQACACALLQRGIYYDCFTTSALVLPPSQLQVILGPEGVAPIGGEGGGGVLGRGGIDRVLAIAPGQEPLLSAGDRRLGSGAQGCCALQSKKGKAGGPCQGCH